MNCERKYVCEMRRRCLRPPMFFTPHIISGHKACKKWIINGEAGTQRINVQKESFSSKFITENYLVGRRQLQTRCLHNLWQILFANPWRYDAHGKFRFRGWKRIRYPGRASIKQRLLSLLSVRIWYLIRMEIRGVVSPSVASPIIKIPFCPRRIGCFLFG